MSDILPFLKLKLKDICFDPNVQNYCNNPKYKCPNYNSSWACPPQAPYLEKTISKFKTFFLIYLKFNLTEFYKRSSFYSNEVDRDYMEKEIYDFLNDYNEIYVDKLILWDGYCRICSKEGKKCTYILKKACRYPNEIRYSMEAVGIDVDKTVKNVNIILEWPPLNYSYRFGLICLK
ncbi:MAG: DUF2284 domain-containing protein [Promethearchaeota archaeon]